MKSSLEDQIQKALIHVLKCQIFSIPMPYKSILFLLYFVLEFIINVVVLKKFKQLHF